LEASVDPAALARARQEHRQVVISLVVVVLALTTLLLVGPVLDRRALARARPAYLTATAVAVGLVVLARLLLGLALPVGLTPVLSPDVYHWPRLGIVMRHPADFLLTALAALAVVALVAGAIERRRQLYRGHRQAVLNGRRPSWAFLLSQAAGGAALALIVIGYERFLAETFRRSTVDILHFSPHPWQTDRMTMALGLVCFHAALVWALVLAWRLLFARWRSRQGDLRVALLLLLSWGLPIAMVWAWAWSGLLSDLPRIEALLIVGAIAAAALFGPRGLIRLRHASQGYRLVVAFFALLAPATVMYPSLVFFEEGARRRIVETDYGPEVLDQRESLQMRLRAAQAEIDGREAALQAYLSVPAPAPARTSGPTAPSSCGRERRSSAIGSRRPSSCTTAPRCSSAGSPSICRRKRPPSSGARIAVPGERSARSARSARTNGSCCTPDAMSAAETAAYSGRS
jgi:hypothetical protein